VLAGPDKFVGHWVYQAGSTETVSCSDTSTKTNDLSGDFVDVAIKNTVLTASYFCDWAVTLGPAGDATVIKPGQSCSQTVNDMTTGMTMFTWHGTTFTLHTLEGKTATLNATIGVNYLDDATKTSCATSTMGCAGTCTIEITGKLQKS
jgi:hypothetical protein